MIVLNQVKKLDELLEEFISADIHGATHNKLHGHGFGTGKAYRKLPDFRLIEIYGGP